MRYSIKRQDGTVVVEGLALGEATLRLRGRADTRGEQGERIEHDPVYPLLVTDEQTPTDDYTLYSSSDDMLSRAARDARMVRVARSEDGRSVTATNLVSAGNGLDTAHGVIIKGGSDRLAYDAALELAASMRARGL